MKKLIFSGYATTQRGNIVTLSPFYQSMAEEIKSKISKNESLELSLGRITDTGFVIAPAVKFFDFTEDEKNKNILNASYYGEYVGPGDKKIKMEKTIRFDNPLGEIPILPEYQQLPKFFLVGEELEHYKNFINEAREMLSNEIGSDVQLQYKNDDGTFSVVHAAVKEVNKGNIFTEDYNEILVVDNKSNTVNILFERKKNHRFISQIGYLIGVCPPIFEKGHVTDDGIFGQEKLWKF